jgi:hypothetical protein
LCSTAAWGPGGLGGVRGVGAQRGQVCRGDAALTLAGRGHLGGEGLQGGAHLVRVVEVAGIEGDNRDAPASASDQAFRGELPDRLADAVLGRQPPSYRRHMAGRPWTAMHHDETVGSRAIHAELVHKVVQSNPLQRSSLTDREHRVVAME